MHDNLSKLQAEALEALAAATEAAALEAWRVRYLSRKGGALSAAMDVIGKLPREERPAYGQAANEVKANLEAAFGARQEALKQAALAAELARLTSTERLERAAAELGLQRPGDVRYLRAPQTLGSRDP